MPAVKEGFWDDIKNGEISKYITATDIAAAITAGIIAYIRNQAQPDDEQVVADQSGEPTGLSASHRTLPNTSGNQRMIGGFDEEGYMHDCDMMIGNKRVMAVFDKDGNVTQWLDKNGNPFKFKDGNTQARYEYWLKSVAGANGKQPEFKGSFDDFVAQSHGKYDFEVVTKNGVRMEVHDWTKDEFVQGPKGKYPNADFAKFTFQHGTASSGLGAKMITPSPYQITRAAERLGIDANDLQQVIASGKADSAMEKLLSYASTDAYSAQGFSTSGNQLIHVLDLGGRQKVLDTFYQDLLAGKSDEEIAKNFLKTFASSETYGRGSFTDKVIKTAMQNAGMQPISPAPINVRI